MGKGVGCAGLGVQGGAGQVALSRLQEEFKFEPSLAGGEGGSRSDIWGGTQAEGKREVWREPGAQGVEGASSGHLASGEGERP